MKIKNLFLGILLIGVNFFRVAQADTIANYMIITNNIPVMAMKPDEQSQSWVRSAQKILISTDETMGQTIVSMNAVAAKQGHPIFCFPPGVPFDATTVDDIIQKTYADLVKTQGPNINMSVSDVLVIGMLSRYSCSALPASSVPMQSVSTNASPTTQPTILSASNTSGDPYATATQVAVSADDSPPVL